MKAKDVFQYVLGALIVIGFFVLLYLLVSKEVPGNNKDLLNLVVGALIGSFAAIVGYFYGSSKGSQEKTDIMAKQMK
jgi:drug/metabolite transporter (DMT)-like permease